MKVKLIFGPPGTGKTTYLLNILEQELTHVAPSDIAYVSFTKEGAYQGRDRAVTKFGYEERSFPYFRTLHSLAFRALKMSRSQVITRRHYKTFSDKMGMNFSGYYTEELRHNDDQYLFFNILHRNNPKAAFNYAFELDTTKLKFVTLNYRRFKEYYHIYDFTDMIEMFVKANEAIPVKVAIIDEAQDLTTLQWKMVWTAFRDCERIYIAGDDDQAIYEWSGADVDYFLRIQGDVEILHHSFRLPHNIVKFSQRITRAIENRIDKQYTGLKEKGTITRVMDIGEIPVAKQQDQTWMFLSRNHCFLKRIVEYLRDAGLVYSYNGELSVSPRKIDAINRFERCRKGKQQMEVVVLPHLKPKINPNLPWYDNFNWEPDELKYYRDLVHSKVNTNVCNIRVNTIHSVKGAEADNVVLLLDITRQIHANLQVNADSEYRVLYVGCTRVKHNLYVVESQSRYEYPLGDLR